MHEAVIVGFHEVTGPQNEVHWMKREQERQSYGVGRPSLYDWALILGFSGYLLKSIYLFIKVSGYLLKKQKWEWEG